MSVKCEICGKEFKNEQGLRGHLTFKHGVTSDRYAAQQGQQATEQTPGGYGGVQREQLNNLQQSIEQLEQTLEQYNSSITESLAELQERVRGLERTRSEDSSVPASIQQLSEQVSRLQSQVAQVSQQKLQQGITYGAVAQKEKQKVIDHIEEAAKDKGEEVADTVFGVLVAAGLEEEPTIDIISNDGEGAWLTSLNASGSLIGKVGQPKCGQKARDRLKSVWAKKLRICL